MSSGILRSGKYAAAPVLIEPLLPNKESRRTESLSSDDFSNLGEEASAQSDGRVLPESMSTKDIISTVGVGLLTAAGLAASLSAMVAFPGPAVLLMGGICMGNSPVVAKKHLSIAKSAGARISVNTIREEVKLLKCEVDFLEEAVDDLQAEASVLTGVEESLQKIAREQGTNVDELVNLVNENEEILNQMKYNLKETFVAAMANIIIKSDVDGDMAIDLKELPLLSIRLQIQLEPYGIKLDTAMFEAMVKEDNDITNVLKFCGDILYGDVDTSNGEDDNSVDSELTFDFESFCKDLDEGNPHKMTAADKMSMVTVDGRLCKGSVEVARGNRMALHPCAKKKDARIKSIDMEVKRRQTKLATRRKTLKSVKETSETRITLGGIVHIRGKSAET